MTKSANATKQPEENVNQVNPKSSGTGQYSNRNNEKFRRSWHSGSIQFNCNQ